MTSQANTNPKFGVLKPANFKDNKLYKNCWWRKQNVVINDCHHLHPTIKPPYTLKIHIYSKVIFPFHWWVFIFTCPQYVYVHLRPWYTAVVIWGSAAYMTVITVINNMSLTSD